VKFIQKDFTAGESGSKFVIPTTRAGQYASYHLKQINDPSNRILTSYTENSVMDDNGSDQVITI
jgi:hypothetical protein